MENSSSIIGRNFFIGEKYELNNCMPCIDKGSGYICSYPYFEVNHRSELFGKYWDRNYILISLRLRI